MQLARTTAWSRLPLGALLFVIVSYGVACLVGGGLAGLMLLVPGMSRSDFSQVFAPPFNMLGTLGQLLGMLVMWTACSALLPFLVAIALLKWRRIENIVLYGLAGALVSIAAMLIFAGQPVFADLIASAWQLILSGGIAGLAYRLCEGLLEKLFRPGVTP
ncbi:MAG TPA: hypothetical protein VGM83_15995 [Devosiaceae bacterium]|jgi:hypothetical protein